MRRSDLRPMSITGPRVAHFFYLIMSFGISPAFASAAEDLTVLKSSAEFTDLSQMLPKYLMKLAFGHLEQRRQLIGNLTTPEDVARRRAYVRERIIQAV